MKFKSTLLTLLVVGLFLMSSFAMAADQLIVSLASQNNSTYTMDETAAFNGVPLLVLKIQNTFTTSKTITSMEVTTGGASTAFDANDFTAKAFNDVNKNGKLDLGDVELTAAAVNLTTGADIALALATNLVVEADSTRQIIVTVNTVAATAAADIVELIWDNTASGLTAAGVTDAQIVDTATAALDAGVAANVPQLTIAAGPGTVTLAASSGPVIAASVGNKESNVKIVSFKLTADGTVSHVLNKVVLEDGGWTAAFGDVGATSLYIDLGTVGTLDAQDILVARVSPLTVITETFNLSAFAAATGAPVFIPAGASVEMLLVANLLGTAGVAIPAANEIIAADIDASASQVDGNTAFTGADLEGANITVVPLSVTLATGDLTGPPFSRPNGKLDNIKVTFSQTISDATFAIANWNVISGAFGHTETFTATYNGDVANNNMVYIKIDENDAGLSNTLSTVTYAIGTTVVSVDGKYALPAFGPTAAADAAAPAPLSVATVDANGDGHIDGLNIQMTEALAGASVASGAGLTVTGYTVASASAVDPADASLWAGTATLWKVVLTPLAAYDTGAKPNYTYNIAAGSLADATANKVATFNQLNIPTADKAAPTVVHAKTHDGNNNGQFDTLEIGLSEPIRLDITDAALTEANVVDNTGADGFNFGAAHDATYNFVGSGNTGLGTMTLMLPVTEVGSYDTAVMPSLIFAGNNLTDYSANYLAAQTFAAVDSGLVDTAAKVWLEDGISARITSALTADDNGNGRLDGYDLIFSEAMGTDADTYKTMTVAGYTIASATIASANVSLVLTEIESGYDTGAVPQVTYSGGTVVDANGAALSILTADTVVEVDNAYPLLMKAVTADRNHNGKIDMLNLTFSESMDTTGVNYDAATSLNDEITLTLGYALVQDSLVVFSSDTKTARVYLVEGATVDTAIKPVLTYAAAGTKLLKDKATPKLTLADVATLATTDGAAPVPVAAKTVDKNADGYLDGVAITFTEDFVIASTDSALVKGAVALTKQSNAIDLTAAAISKDAADSTLTLVGTSAMGAAKWDTGKLPYMHIAAASGIKDAAGNVVAAVDSFLTTDGAAPILAMARAQIEAKTIDMTFSEQVAKSIGPVVALDATGVKYINILDDTKPVVITAIADANADKVTFEATTDSTLTLARATTDKVASVAGSVVDLVGNAVAVDSIVISDNTRPVLLLATTMDVDGNGLIETIKLVFDEAVKDANLVGYTLGPDTLGYKTGDKKVKDFWTIDEPFTVVGYNFTHSPATGTADSLANIATAHARKNLWISASEIVPNVEDTPNDTILYLLVRNTSFPAEGNTGAKPHVGYTGTSAPPFGGGVSDFKPNYVATFSDTTRDGAAPVLMSGAMDSTGTKMTVVVSEKLQKTLPLAKDAFLWSVGDQQLDYGSLFKIVNFNQPNDHTLLFTVGAGDALGAGVVSKLNFRAAATIQDKYGVWNSYAASKAINIDPSTGVPIVDVAEEAEALPTVYALDQNFPNPFNPTTTISYDVAGDGGHVSIVIYNVNGQKVRTLVNEVKAPGFYKMVWDGRNDLGENVASGVYLYKMVSGDFSKIQKMTFIK